MDKDRIHHNEPDSLVQKLYQQVENNLQNEQFGVEQLAHNMNISRSQLHRKLKKTTGQSVNQFIREYRLQRALDLLKQREKTVSEVAFEVGFGSHSYFTTCFTEHYGYPPAEVKYRFSEPSDPADPTKEPSRQLAAIMFTDIVGYTALMGADEHQALELVRLSKELQKPLVEKHKGSWLKEMGDGALAKFDTALDAVNCALEIQRIARADFGGKLRIGIHTGDITIENDDVFGDGVNVAARLESIADPGGIYISDHVEKSIRGQTEVQARYLGELKLKNVDYGVRTYAVQGVGLPIPQVKQSKELRGRWWAEVQRRGLTRVAISYLVVATLLVLLWHQAHEWVLNLPSWSLTALVTGLVIGFPLAIYLAWLFERSPQGFVKTNTTESWQNPYGVSKRKPFTSKYIIAGLLLIIVLLYIFPRQSAKSSVFSGEITDKSIAVLPFKNMSGDPEQEAMCDGLTDEIIHHLSMIKSFDKVISLSSVMTFKNSDKTLTEIANQLDVDIVLEGSFKQSGDLIRITAQLIDAVNDDHLWSEVYEQPFGDIFAIQSDMAKKIAARFNAEITPEETVRLDKKPTENTEAYILFKKGRHKSENGGYQDAIDLYKKAIEMDPNLAEAYVALAGAYMFASDYYTGDRSIQVEDPLPLIQKALALDPELSEAYQVLGFLMILNWDFLDAEKYTKKAMELDPQNPGAKLLYAHILVHIGNFQDAPPYVEQAVILNPTYYGLLGQLAKFYIYAGNIARANQVLKEYEFLFPNDLHGAMGKNYLHLNNLDKAILNLEKDPASPLENSYLAIAYTKNGQDQKAKQVVERLKIMSQKQRLPSANYSIGLYYSGIGHVEESLNWLERAFESHDAELYSLKSEPLLQPLHGNPRYEALLKKIGFP